MLCTFSTVVDFFPLQDFQKWPHSHKDFLIGFWIASVPRGSCLRSPYATARGSFAAWFGKSHRAQCKAEAGMALTYLRNWHSAAMLLNDLIVVKDLNHQNVSDLQCRVADGGSNQVPGICGLA
jgi:hypothetical protein